MQATSFFKKQRKTIFIILTMCILVFGIGGAAYAANREWQNTKDLLMKRTASVAIVLPVDDIKALHGDESDTKRPQYKSLKDTLAALKQANPDLDFTYLMGQKDAQVYFMVDSEEAGSEGYSPPGQLYYEASDELKGIFNAKQPVLEGPLRDRWGIFLSGLAPVVDPSTGEVVAVVGLDVPANPYIVRSVIYGLVPLLLMTILLVALLLQRRVMKRTEALLAQKALFVTTASHDIRSPMTGVLWALQLLDTELQNYPDQQTRNIVKRAGESCKQILSTVSAVLDAVSFEQLADGKLLKMEPTDIMKIMSDVVAMHGSAADTRQIKVVMEGAWPTEFVQLVEPLSLHRALGNILSNAIKYSPDGATVHMRFAQTDDYWQIDIVDEGKGMSDEDLERLGEEIFPKEKHRTVQSVGIGIGLYFTRRVIKNHHGTLKISSPEGQGSIFSVKIPRRNSLQK